MKKQIFSVILLFFIILSNISLSLTNFYSFILEKKSLNYSNIVDIQEQCSMLINIPKEFVNICVKVSYDIKALASFGNKIQYLFANTYKFEQHPIALIYSNIKLKVTRNIIEYKNLLFNFINISVKIFVIPIILFYLLCYIGLLRLFGSVSFVLSLINRVRNSVCLHI